MGLFDQSTTPLGWTTEANQAWQALGGLVASVKNYSSGATKANSDAQAAIAAQQKQAIADAKLAEQKTAAKKIQAAVMIQNVKAWSWSHWYIFAGAILIAILIALRNPIKRVLNFKAMPKRRKSRPRKRVMRVKRVSKTRSRSTPRKTVTRRTSSSGFRKKLNGKVYTSPKSWGRAMQELRRKKRK